MIPETDLNISKARRIDHGRQNEAGFCGIIGSGRFKIEIIAAPRGVVAVRPGPSAPDAAGQFGRRRAFMDEPVQVVIALLFPAIEQRERILGVEFVEILCYGTFQDSVYNGEMVPYWDRTSVCKDGQLATQSDEIDQLGAIIDNLKNEITDKDRTIALLARVVLCQVLSRERLGRGADY